MKQKYQKVPKILTYNLTPGILWKGVLEPRTHVCTLKSQKKSMPIFGKAGDIRH